MSEILVIQQGDSARIEIVLPIDKMAQVQDVVCTVGNRLSYSLSKNTLTPTATANVFHLDILSSQSQKHTGNLEIVVAIDYSDIGVKKTKRAENLFVQVVRNENYFNNNSISELVSAVVIVTVDEEVVTGIPILASYLVINSGGGGGATNLGYTASPTNGIVTSDTGTDATIPLATTINAGLLSPSEKTAITHANRSTLDLITEAFTTSLKSAYDGAVSGLSSLLATGVRLITNTEITKLTNTTGTNTGDETTDSIQTKRPLKTINSQSLEGSGDLVVSGGGAVDTILYQNTNHNLTSSTSLQKIFNVGSSGNGSFPISSGLSYEFEATIYINDTLQISGTNVNFGMLGDVSFCENIAYSVISSPTYLSSIIAKLQLYKINSFASQQILDNLGTSDSGYYAKIYGTFTVNANGIIIPSIALPTQLGDAFVETGSTFKIRTITTSNNII